MNVIKLRTKSKPAVETAGLVYNYPSCSKFIAEYQRLFYKPIAILERRK